MAIGSGLFGASGVSSAGGMGTRVGSAFVSIFADTSGLAKGFAQTEAQLKSLGGRLQAAGAVMGRTGAFLTRNLTIPLAALGGISVKMAADFEKSMVKVQTLSDTAGFSMNELRDNVLALSRETAQAPTDLAESLFFVASAGLKSSQILPVLEATAKGAAAQLGDAATIGQLLTSVLVAYGKNAPTAASAMDVLTAAIRAGKAEPADLSASLGTVVPVAAQMGVTFDQLAGAIGAATNLGIEATRAATGLRYMLIQLLNPSEQAKKEFEGIGTSAGEIQKAIRTDGLVPALDDLAQSFDLTTAKGKEAFFTAVGGVRAGQVALALVGKSFENTQRVMDATGNAARGVGASFDQVFSKQTQTDAFQFQKAWNELKLAAIDAGTALMPIARDIVDVVGNIAEAFSALPGPVQESIVGIGLFVAALGPLLRIGGLAATGIGKLISAFSGAGAAAAGGGQLAGQLALPGMAAGEAGGGALAGTVTGLGEFALIAGGAAVAAGMFSKAFDAATASTQELATSTGLSTRNVEALKDAVNHSMATFSPFASTEDRVREAGQIADEVIKDLVKDGYSLVEATGLVNATIADSTSEIGGWTASMDTFEQQLRGRLGILETADATTLLQRRFDTLTESVQLSGRYIDGVFREGEGRDIGAQFDEEAMQNFLAAVRSVKESGLDLDTVFGDQLRAALDAGSISWARLTARMENAGLAMPYERAGDMAQAIFRLDTATVEQRRHLADSLAALSAYNIELSRGARAQIESAFAGGQVNEVQREINRAAGPEALSAITDNIDGLTKQQLAWTQNRVAAGDYVAVLIRMQQIERRQRREARREARAGFGREGDPTAAMGAAVREQRKQVEDLLGTEPQLKSWGETLRRAAEFKPEQFDTALEIVDQLGVSFDDLNAKTQRGIRVAVRTGNAQRLLRVLATALLRIKDKKVDIKADDEDVYDKIHRLEQTQVHFPDITIYADTDPAQAAISSFLGSIPSTVTIGVTTPSEVRGRRAPPPPTGKTGIQTGGWVGGAGRGDIVPMMLEPGEFVVRRAVAQRAGTFLEGFNRAGMAFHRPSRSRGSSPVMLGARSDRPGAGASQRTLNVNVQGRMEYTPDDLRRNLEGWWRRRDW